MDSIEWFENKIKKLEKKCNHGESLILSYDDLDMFIMLWNEVIF